ncbi:S8 family serine peptidase [Roseomonas sp. 18066]|uniref:S8 family serine peptidase n=1 Tax=Roseomonas sp. 18066 TaxID=2681412 RepID=UPI0013573DD2|nr:S8 family serine peptidase [Roseomonas sp. 18066]
MASFNDPRFAAQWQLQPGHGINITPLYDDYAGQGIKVGLIDTILDTDNPELGGQVDPRAGQQAAAVKGGEAAATSHGTGVALVLAAAANNNYGGVGAAYGVTLVSYRLDARADRTVAQETEMLGLQWQVDVSNNSWSRSGDHFRDDFGRAEYAGAAAAIAGAVAHGRDGLGTVIVRSAGNNGATDDVNTHSYSNNRYTLLVGATDARGLVQGFSNPGAALLVMAPASATSYAAPLASATAALMLQANPGLGWRDVQAILALTARVTDAANAGWFDNAGEGWNGGGLHVSRRAGFGLIDARAAVRLAETWQAQSTSANQLEASAAATPEAALADAGSSVFSLTIDRDLAVERAEVTLSLDHAKIGELRLVLVSPAGTESVLLDQLHQGDYDPASGQLRFTFASTQFLREAARGDWQLRIDDLAAGNAGLLRSWSLTLLGSAASDDTQHIYTDEFLAVASADPTRAVLRDAAGTDTINAAAVSGDSWIDLGGDSRIAGATLRIAEGTLIENAIGGDGDDVLIGNALANHLQGGRGDDHLQGGAGDDILEGGLGDDLLEGGLGDDLYRVTDTGDRVVEQASEGHDRVDSSIDYALPENVEELTLLDGAVAGRGNDGDNRVTGNAAANLLEGGGGDDWLDGGAGADRMLGGLGNDTYVVDDPGDLVEEQPFAGYDTVRSAISYRLPASVEYLVLTGEAAIDGTGNASANVITGNDAANTLRGEDGPDRLSGGGGDDLLHGGAGSDWLEGGDGHDWLHGGAGIDLMRGGAGDDTYVVDDSGDMVSEQPGGGDDRVISTVDFSLPSEVEVLALTALAATRGTGNRLDNSIIGHSGANLLQGMGGDDSLYGGGGDDRLEGGSGNDLLAGGAGADTMLGGSGDDIYLVDDPGDIVVEERFQGFDLVQSSVSFTLPDWVEYLTLTGAAAIDGTGNDGSNVLNGNWGNNLLRGEGGADTLRGMAGDDILWGGAGNDLLSGGSGGDVLRGGAGNDLVYGGLGADRFVVAPGEGDDRFGDFRPSQGDVLVLEGFGPDLDSWDAVLALLTRQGSNLVLDLGGVSGGQGGTVTFLGLPIGALGPDHVIFG